MSARPRHVSDADYIRHTIAKARAVSQHLDREAALDRVRLERLGAPAPAPAATGATGGRRSEAEQRAILRETTTEWLRKMLAAWEGPEWQSVVDSDYFLDRFLELVREELTRREGEL